MSATVEVKVHAPSGTIVLNRPDKRNALSRSMLSEFMTALSDLHQEARVRSVIVTGSGSSFCAGLDLHEMHETSQSEESLQQWHEDVMRFRELIETMWRFPKPIIAALNGPTCGGGAAVALACDTVIASPQATVQIPETRHGLVSGILTPLLCFRIGGGHAGNLLLTGRILSAADALQVGICQELVADELLWARAQEICESISHFPPEAVQLTKRLLNETVGEQMMSCLSLGAAASATARTTEAAHEGITAFVEKRDPQWPQ